MSLIGGIAKMFSSGYRTPATAASEVYGYSSDGQLVSKGSYGYNPVSGKYELSAGTITPAEKQERSKILASMTDLISRVGETPASFANYANGVAQAYQEKGDKYLDEQYNNYQTKLNESLAKRGLSSSRAGVDLNAELLKDKSRAQSELFDQSQITANNIASTLRGQDQNALSLLGNIQSGNTQADQNWLSNALAAQSQGQNIENNKATIANKNKDLRLQGINEIGDSIEGALKVGAFMSAMSPSAATGAAAGAAAGAATGSSAVSLSPTYAGTSGGIAYDLPNYFSYNSFGGNYGTANISDLLRS
jgi:hypothetical protein